MKAEQKRHTKEKKTQQHLANLQLKKDSQQQVQTSKTRPKGLSSKKKVTIAVKSDIVKEEVQIPLSWLRREIKLPHRFDDFVLR